MTISESMLDVAMLSGIARPAPSFTIVDADARQLAAYRALRRETFVIGQGVFEASDRDALDDDPRTIVLVAVDLTGRVVGGVRLSPAIDGTDIGWWTGSRLVRAPDAGGCHGIGQALVRAACARAVSLGVLRFEATVQLIREPLFAGIGWLRTEPGDASVFDLGGVPHVRMRFPIDRIERLITQTKGFLASILDPFGGWSDGAPESLGGEGFVGDDGAPVPGTDVIAACDAILPALIERDPEWAGWCSVLVNANDLAAMGATPVGLMNSIAARDVASARRIMNGIRSGAEAWGIPVLGGHSQIGGDASLVVTALGRTADPVPGGGGRPGHAVSLTADLSGSWRPGFEGSQWDSSSTRSGGELRMLARMVAEARPAAAKDVSMAGIVGTVGMLAEASGCGAVLDVSAVPRPASEASMGDWLTCFPGFGMITTDRPGQSRMQSSITTTAEIGVLTRSRGVSLRWPDGVITEAAPAAVTGLGRA